MLQDGHAAPVQVPSLGHGGTCSYVGQQDGNTANGTTVPPPEQRAVEGIVFVFTCEYSSPLLFRVASNHSCVGSTGDDTVEPTQE